jgi:hypothetical protein
MLWMIGGIAILTVLAAGMWFLAPTVRTFRGPDFEPTSKDDASVLQAQQSGTSAGAGDAGVGT